MEPVDPRFVTQLMSIGIFAYREQETLWRIARQCATKAGQPTTVGGAGAGAVMVPGAGLIPGAVVGILVGLAGGTVNCVVLNGPLREQLKRLAQST
jgi:hypothetical protein